MSIKTELKKISNSEPMRRQFKGKRILSAMWGMCIGNYSKNNWNKWCNGWSTDENDFLPFMGVIIPKGTIEKNNRQKKLHGKMNLSRCVLHEP